MSLPHLDEQVDELARAVSMRMSGLIVGVPGLGKTVCLRRLRQRLPETRYQMTYLKVTRLSGRDLCREIGQAIGAKRVSSYPALVRAAQERMQDVSSSEGICPVIMLDDAHALRDQGFELMKILSNFEMDSRLVVSFILAGHPKLKDRLYHPDLADIKQRIIHCGQLRLLSREESTDYIRHRMSLVGCSTIPFDEGALEIILEMTRGNMRAIDNLALKSLSQAEAKKDLVVTNQHVILAGAQLWT